MAGLCPATFLCNVFCHNYFCTFTLTKKIKVMRLQLTEKANQQFKTLDFEIDYHECTEYDQLLQDAMLYVEGGYEENEFDNLDEWCSNVGMSEYSGKYLKAHPNVVREKVDRMIQEDIITIID